MSCPFPAPSFTVLASVVFYENSGLVGFCAGSWVRTTMDLRMSIFFFFRFCIFCTLIINSGKRSLLNPCIWTPLFNNKTGITNCYFKCCNANLWSWVFSSSSGAGTCSTFKSVLVLSQTLVKGRFGSKTP